MRVAAALLAAFCASAPRGAPWGQVSAAEPPPGRLKARVCVTCHGPLGIGTMPDSPNLAGQPRLYLVEQLKNFRSGKRAHEVMGVIAKPLTDTDIEDLAQWYSSIVVDAKEPK